MNEHQKTTAGTCLEAAEGNSMAFPQIVGTLMEAGFESYAIDFRRATATYYLPDGESIELPARRVDAPIAPAFDTAGMRAAIGEAQQEVPGYTYKGFCEKAVGPTPHVPGVRLALAVNGSASETRNLKRRKHPTT